MGETLAVLFSASPVGSDVITDTMGTAFLFQAIHIFHLEYKEEATTGNRHQERPKDEPTN